MFIDADGCKTLKRIPKKLRETRAQAYADKALPIMGSNVHEIILFYKQLHELLTASAKLATGKDCNFTNY